MTLRSRLPLTLALCATLFGGGGIGVGNAVWGDFADGIGASEPTQKSDPSAHHHHQSHSEAFPPILTLPAHCVFCIDGMTPQPVELGLTYASPGIARTALSGQARPALEPRDCVTAYQGRAPPILS